MCQHRPPQQRPVPRQQHLGVALGVSDDVVRILAKLDDPHPDVLSDKMVPGAVGLEGDGGAPRAVLDYSRGQLLHLRGDRGRPRVELRDVHDRELVLGHEIERPLEVLLSLCRESADDVCRERDAWHLDEKIVGKLLEVSDRVLSLHVRQHPVTAALHGDVEELEDAGVVEHARDRLHVRQDVRRVRHPHAEHDAVREAADNAVEHRGERDVDVAPVRTRVLARQPQLAHPFLDHVLHASHDGLWEVRDQVPAGVLCLAVGAVVQAPHRDGHDLDESVAPDLGKVERGAHSLAQQPHHVALRSLLHHLHHPVDLSRAHDREVLQFLAVRIALRHAPRSHHCRAR
mmetsp:Transcript_17703/g.42714  ORF Transcript_17703/g.42714 Transcript_17703/m.42714 type:complete len:344 (-) Transcript_17703:501-1532(-)